MSTIKDKMSAVYNINIFFTITTEVHHNVLAKIDPSKLSCLGKLLPSLWLALHGL